MEAVQVGIAPKIEDELRLGHVLLEDRVLVDDGEGIVAFLGEVTDESEPDLAGDVLEVVMRVEDRH